MGVNRSLQISGKEREIKAGDLLVIPASIQGMIARYGVTVRETTN